MNTLLADKAPWIVRTDSMSLTLEVILSKETVILSWNQFVYAQGSDDEVRIAFASHEVIVRGTGLSPLLRAIPEHRVKSIREVPRSEQFLVPELQSIRKIEIRRTETE